MSKPLKRHYEGDPGRATCKPSLSEATGTLMTRVRMQVTCRRCREFLLPGASAEWTRPSGAVR